MGEYPMVPPAMFPRTFLPPMAPERSLQAANRQYLQARQHHRVYTCRSWCGRSGSQWSCSNEGFLCEAATSSPETAFQGPILFFCSLVLDELEVYRLTIQGSVTVSHAARGTAYRAKTSFIC